MNLAEMVYQKVIDLPEEKICEIIDFIDFIATRSRPQAQNINLAMTQDFVTPNAETWQAIQELEQGHGVRFKSVDLLMANLNADD